MINIVMMLILVKLNKVNYNEWDVILNIVVLCSFSGVIFLELLLIFLRVMIIFFVY